MGLPARKFVKELITVLGFYGKQNIGDESYRLAFPLLFPDFDFQFTDDLEKVPPSDYIILGGGNVIDHKFFEQLEKTNIPKLLFSVGIPAKEDTRRPHLNLLNKFKQFQKICVRDYISYDMLYNKNIKVTYLPDFAFVLSPNPIHGKELIKRLYKEMDGEFYEKIVVVVMNGFLAAGHNQLARDYLTFEKVAMDVARCADATNASFIFVPFGGDQFSNDRMPNSWTASKCKWYKKNLVIYDRLTVQDTLDIISACDAMISTRLHASIFSTISGVPFIDLTHHDKNRAYLESIGKEKWSLDYWFLDGKELQVLLNSFIVDKVKHRKDLLILSSINRHILFNNATYLLQSKLSEVTLVKEIKQKGVTTNGKERRIPVSESVWEPPVDDRSRGDGEAECYGFSGLS